jgi:hypothetical protein
MIGNINSTDPRYIKYLNCSPTKQRIVSFQGCDLTIREGSSTVSSISLCDLSLNKADAFPGFDGCGGFIKKSIVIPPNGNKTITAPEIVGSNGQVQMLIFKVKYPGSIVGADRYITFEYKGWIGPIETLMILSGRALNNGWDMTPYSSNISQNNFSPAIQPTPTSPDISFGGFLLSNPQIAAVQVEIMIFN